MLSEEALKQLEQKIQEYCLAHPEQFLAAMKSYSVLEKYHVDHSVKLS